MLKVHVTFNSQMDFYGKNLYVLGNH